MTSQAGLNSPAAFILSTSGVATLPGVRGVGCTSDWLASSNRMGRLTATAWMPRTLTPLRVSRISSAVVPASGAAQKAVDCFEAGARILHIHVRDLKTGKISKNFQEPDRAATLSPSRHGAA